MTQPFAPSSAQAQFAKDLASALLAAAQKARLCASAALGDARSAAAAEEVDANLARAAWFRDVGEIIAAVYDASEAHDHAAVASGRLWAMKVRRRGDHLPHPKSRLALAASTLRTAIGNALELAAARWNAARGLDEAAERALADAVYEAQRERRAGQPGPASDWIGRTSMQLAGPFLDPAIGPISRQLKVVDIKSVAAGARRVLERERSSFGSDEISRALVRELGGGKIARGLFDFESKRAKRQP